MREARSSWGIPAAPGRRVIDGETGLLVDGSDVERSPTPSPSCSRTPSVPARWGRRDGARGAGARLAGHRAAGWRGGSGSRGSPQPRFRRSGAGAGVPSPGMAEHAARRRARTLPGLRRPAVARTPVVRACASGRSGARRPSPTGAGSRPIASPSPSTGRRDRDQRGAAVPDGGPGSPTCRRGPMWPCPVCETANPIELDFCATCGTSFASMMRQETSARRRSTRATAFRRSLLFPGLGHRMIPGRAVDGFARGVLFAMLLIAMPDARPLRRRRRTRCSSCSWSYLDGDRARLRADGVRGVAARRRRRAVRVVAGVAVGDRGDLDPVDRSCVALVIGTAARR